MPMPLPSVTGVRHADVELPTGVRLHVAEAGDAGAPPLLLVHGWPEHWWAWRDVIPALAQRHRVIAPDLRGFGWSGQPADGDFAKERLADDMIALLDALGVARAGYLGHDWGAWTGYLVAVRAPERLTRLMTVAMLHPWAARLATVRNAWRAAYQLPVAAPVLGPAVLRDGRVLRAVLTRLIGPGPAEVYAEVLREPERAAASSALYRTFQLRELPAILAGRYAGARRARALVAQAAAAGAREPDLLALQEVTPQTWPLWEAACATLGLRHVRCSLDGADPARAPAGPRRHGVLLASRRPLELAPALGVPWPESGLAARADGVEVHVVHVPNAANGLVKPRTLAAMRAGLAGRRGPVIACGDWNTPRRELPDGTVWSFARDGKGRLREERAGFWDEAELGVVPGLAELGDADAFRALHGYASREPSWAWRHGGGGRP